MLLLLLVRFALQIRVHHLSDYTIFTNNNMVTFYANPDESNEPWIERAAIPALGFRNWHYIFFCSSAIGVIVVLTCCCIKFRVPRTKQEIEADYRRKKLTEKFRRRLKLIQNQEMDSLDLQKALEIIQEDYRNESIHIEVDEEDISLGAGDFNSISSGNQAEPQQPIVKKV